MALYNGNAQDNSITGSAPADQIYGFKGNDTLDGGDGNDLLDGGNDHDVLSGGLGHDSLYGGSGNDVLTGGEGNDLLAGGLGQDWVSYAGGGEIVANLSTGTVTGQGTDSLSGIENIQGSGYNDIIQGNASANKLYGGDGNDRLIVSYGTDELNGGQGMDLLEFLYTGPVQVSLLQGTYYMNMTNGGTATGFENINGSDYNDILRRDHGVNVIYGRGGNDVMEGYGGADALAATGGNDTLTGGTDSDGFYIQTSSGDIVLTDFTQGSDYIDLSYYFDQNGNSAIWSGSATQQGANTVLTLTGQGTSVTVTLYNISAANLTAADFVYGSPDLLPAPYVPSADVFTAAPQQGYSQLNIAQFDDGLDLIDLSALGFVYDPALGDYVSQTWYNNVLYPSGNDVVTTFHNGAGDVFTLVIGNTQLSQIDLSDFIF